MTLLIVSVLLHRSLIVWDWEWGEWRGRPGVSWFREVGPGCSQCGGRCEAAGHLPVSGPRLIARCPPCVHLSFS